MNVLWCIGYTGGESCYLNVTQEEAERRYREANDGHMATITKVEFEDEFESYSVYGGEVVDPVCPDDIVPPTYIRPTPTKPDAEQVLSDETLEF